MSSANTFPTAIPEATRRLGQAILKPNDLCRFLGENAEALFPAQMFDDLYAEQGRPSVSPVMLAIVSVLQFAENLPDRQASQQVVKRLDWKYALRQELDWMGFHYSDLCRFRQRLTDHGAAGRVFDQVLTWLKAQGYVNQRELQRTDSTHLLAHVASLGRIELLAETLRLALTELLRVAAKWVWQTFDPPTVQACLIHPNSFSRARKPLAQWESELKQMAYTVLNRATEQGQASWRELPALGLLYTILTQEQVCLPDATTAVWEALIKRSEGDLQSPHDPEARYSQKHTYQWVGYKVHLTETIDRQGCNLITDVWVTSAQQHDSVALTDIQNRLAQRELTPTCHYVDRGYMSAELIATSQQRGIDLRGHVQSSPSSKAEGFRLQDFAVDIVAQQARCPMGKTSVRWSQVQGTKNVDYRAFFGQQCRTCAAFADQRCTTLRSGRRLDINQYHDVLQARRQEQQTPQFRHEQRRRTGIESTISESVRGYNLRYNRYRGLAKTQLQAAFTATALNLNRLMQHQSAA